MPTPILRNNVGSPIIVTAANSVANNAYANSSDKLRIQNIGNALLADFRLTSVTFNAAPVVGNMAIVAVDRDFAGNAGPTPAATILGKVYHFTPGPSTSNTSTGWVMACNNVPLSADCDYWLFNNGTLVSLNTGWVLTAQPWSPGA